MRKSLVLFLISIAGLVHDHIYGQQDAQYTQYMYNTISVNPAYAGSRNVLSVIGLHRSQWVGLEGAPRTQTLSLHTPVGESQRVGVGVSLVNDEIGPTQETYIDIDFSYTIKTSEEGHLAFGLKGGGHLLDVNFDKLSKFDISDPRFQQNIDNKFSPNVGVGLYYYTQKFYAGLSVPNLLETDHFDENNISSSQGSSIIAEERANYYFIAGYTFDWSPNLKFKPALLTKLVFGTPLQVDISANFLLYDKLTLGLAYRWSAAASALIGFQISDALMIGFAYDRESTELGNTLYDDGSYEVMIRFELFKKYSRLLTPRFF